VSATLDDSRPEAEEIRAVAADFNGGVAGLRSPGLLSASWIAGAGTGGTCSFAELTGAASTGGVEMDTSDIGDGASVLGSASD
jgi:hypothetical protein